MFGLSSALGRAAARWGRRDTGATAVEYALIAVFIAVVISVSVGLLGTTVRGLFEGAVEGF